MIVNERWGLAAPQSLMRHANDATTCDHRRQHVADVGRASGAAAGVLQRGARLAAGANAQNSSHTHPPHTHEHRPPHHPKHASQIRIDDSPSVRDAFTSELFRLSPPHLKHLSLRASPNLRRLVLSPLGSCPALETLDLAGCASLEFLLVQSSSLKSLDLAGCGGLTKALVYCPGLTRLVVKGCAGLEKVIIWGDALTELDLSGE